MRRIGDVEVSAIGLGAMQLSSGPGPHDESQALRTIHAALDAGVRLIDTADAYAPDEHTVGHNELIVAKALREWSGPRDEVLVATKGGHTRTPGGGWGRNGSPAYLRQACEASLRRLGTDCIDLYQFHRPDPAVPTIESVGALKELQDEGKIRLIGVSNFNRFQIEEAAAAVELAAVQNELSPAFRSSLDEVDVCNVHGIAFLAWSPLGGLGSARDVGTRHAEFGAIAAERGVSPQQVALAWELAQAPVVIPIPGASRPETILDSLEAADLDLTSEELLRLNVGPRLAGAR